MYKIYQLQLHFIPFVLHGFEHFQSNISKDDNIDRNMQEPKNVM
jgi:hypothetical protein